MTIGELITERGAQFKVFDLGRRITEISLTDFAAFEQQQRSYPSPYLKHAWLGLISWHPTEPGQHSIWFLKLPLDPQQRLQPAARDAFVSYWRALIVAPRTDAGPAPFSFKPDPQRMAYFHALALHNLGQPPTAYYRAAQAYLRGETGLENWQSLGLQGLAELVERLDDDHNGELLASVLPLLPVTPRTALLGFFENIEPNQLLTSAVNDALAQAVAQPLQPPELAVFARALSQSVNKEQRRALFAALLQHPLCYSVELLAALGSRCWQDLEGDLLLRYLECLARNEQGSGAFNALVADLLALPGMHAKFIAALASPQRSEHLATAFQHLLVAVQQESN